MRVGWLRFSVAEDEQMQDAFRRACARQLHENEQLDRCELPGRFYYGVSVFGSARLKPQTPEVQSNHRRRLAQK